MNTTILHFISYAFISVVVQTCTILESVLSTIGESFLYLGTYLHINTNIFGVLQSIFKRVTQLQLQ